MPVEENAMSSTIEIDSQTNMSWLVRYAITFAHFIRPTR